MDERVKADMRADMLADVLADMEQDMPKDVARREAEAFVDRWLADIEAREGRGKQPSPWTCGRCGFDNSYLGSIEEGDVIHCSKCGAPNEID